MTGTVPGCQQIVWVPSGLHPQAGPRNCSRSPNRRGEGRELQSRVYFSLCFSTKSKGFSVFLRKSALYGLYLFVGGDGEAV